AAPSVHLADWPAADESLIVQGLGQQVDAARRVTELGRAARAESKVRTRQPLRRALIASSTYHLLGDELRAQVCEELNIGHFEPLGEAGADLVEYTLKGNFGVLGKKHGKDTPRVAAEIAAYANPAFAGEVLPSGAAISVEVDGKQIAVVLEDVIISERPREGWSVINNQGETVALDLELDEDLRRAGLAREAVRLIQEARKSSGLDVSDRIALSWTANGDMAEALRIHMTEIADEVLALSTQESPAATSFADDELGLSFDITKA
ncbi:MAG: DUF5915 domain-containing protein, partial [Aeromicrobium sp.]